MPPRTYWRKIQAICRKYDILVIADEVITGFGRTGHMFASEHFGISPDILVVSKQITSSYLPLSALMFTDKIYQAVADNTAKINNFGHGFTASGHPVAAAVGLENIKIIQERNLVEHAASVGAQFQEKLRKLLDHPLVGEVRGMGLIAAVELVADKETRKSNDPLGKLGFYFYERGHHHGLIVRAVQDSIAICPPLIISEEQCDELIARFKRTLDDTYAFGRETFGLK